MRHNSKLEQPIKRLKIGANLELRLKNAISPCLVLKKYKTCLNEIRDLNTALIEIHLPHPLFFKRDYNYANISSSGSNEQNMEIYHKIGERVANAKIR